MVKVLIAGGAGYIGSTIASACCDAGIARRQPERRDRDHPRRR
jgi:nucleoside-diphosphate-sugar epimerase